MKKQINKKILKRNKEEQVKIPQQKSFNLYGSFMFEDNWETDLTQTSPFKSEGVFRK